jgi:MFS family permease
MAIYLISLLSVLNQIGVKGSKMLVALYAIELGASPFVIGTLVASYAVFPLLFAVYAGRVIDRRGVRMPMVLGSMGMTAGLALPVMMPVVPVLFLSCGLIGAASLFFHISTHNVVGSLGEGSKRTSNFGTYSVAASLSGFIGPLLVGVMIDGSGYLPTYVLLASIACIPAFVLVAHAGFIPARIKARQEAPGGGIADLLATPSLRRTLFSSGLIITGLDLFNFYMPIYGRSIGLSASVIGAVVGMLAAAAFVVRLWMPALVRRYGERAVLTGSLFMAGATYFAFPSVTNPVALGAISFLLGLGLGCGQPLSILLTYNDSPPGRAGESLGLRLTVNKFTQIAVPLAFGSVGTALGTSPVFWANAVLLLLGGYLSADRRER